MSKKNRLNDYNIKLYTQRDLIEETVYNINIGRMVKMPEEEFKNYLSEYQRVITEHLKEASKENTIIKINALDGLRLEAEYKPPTKRKLYNEFIITKPKISIKAKFTKYFGYFKVNENELYC